MIVALWPAVMWKDNLRSKGFLWMYLESVFDKNLRWPWLSWYVGVLWRIWVGDKAAIRIYSSYVRLIWNKALQVLRRTFTRGSFLLILFRLFLWGWNKSLKKNESWNLDGWFHLRFWFGTKLGDFSQDHPFPWRMSTSPTSKISRPVSSLTRWLFHLLLSWSWAPAVRFFCRKRKISNRVQVIHTRQ